MLLVAQVLLVVGALVVGFRVLTPRRAESSIDVAALSVDVARAVLRYRAQRGTFVGADTTPVVVAVPLGAGYAVRVADAEHASVEARADGGRCVVRLQATDRGPGRPECRR